MDDKETMFELADNVPPSAVIKVVGVGGGGGNAVEHMVAQDIEGVDFICANTDAQALKNSSARTLLQLGNEVTKGLGAGADPKVGRESAEEDRDRIREVMEGADMVFITAGMGGGTGTGAAPIFAQVAKELGILTVAVVTKPFVFEGRARKDVADTGIYELGEQVDSLITIPNNKLLSVLGKNITLLDAFKAANDVLLGAVQGIAELITRPGLINVDFADVRTVMSEMGMAMMGTGVAKGEDRARIAAEAAISSPLLEDINLSGAKGVLVNITAGLDMSIGEFETVGDVIRGFITESATVVVGTVIDPNLNEEMRVTIVVTGLGGDDDEQQVQQQQSQKQDSQQIQQSQEQSGTLTSTKKNDGTVDYDQLQRPTVLRQKAEKMNQESNTNSDDMDYLDIPAFLRRNQDE